MYSADTLAEQKVTLTARLDSLELEKQKQKRRGNSLQELEQHTAVVKDSIERLRKRIALSNTSPVKGFFKNWSASGEQAPGRVAEKTLVPGDLFDWIIVIVGAIALLAGLVLLFGLLKSWTRRTGAQQKKAQKSPPSPASVSESARQNRPAQPSPVSPETPLYKATYQRPRSTSRNAEEAKNTNHASRDEGIELLRQRIGDDIQRIRQFDKSERPAALQDEKSGTHRSEADVKKQILAAARAGMDAATISKKFHVSADQVTLIMKMAGK
ncbi:MAG: hypothetical protein GF398_13415 [Chitinivibrionales bacterium]|nr:hypothetical protein [Chitinivibrionales bacterium]